MRISKQLATSIAVLMSLVLAACERPPVETTQMGYRGTGIVDVQNPRDEKLMDAYPVSSPAASADGPRAGEVYQNVQVLDDLSIAEFTRLMTEITAWVSPEAGCNYCHNPADLASDEVYTKVVSRRMLEMTKGINSGWSSHVGSAGVNCYTCHRGNNVPEYIWFDDPGIQSAMATNAGNLNGQNQPLPSVGYTSLPVSTAGSYLSSASNDRARVNSPSAVPGAGGATIQDTEAVYGLMVHLSQSLDVNCTFCHNTASFQNWDRSGPQRTTAFHGIEMVRTLNQDYLLPLQGVYPENRLGEHGDAPKANCMTCHQGQSKPLGGADAVSAFPSLQE